MALANLDANALEAWLTRVYSPTQAVLVVAGDLDPDAIVTPWPAPTSIRLESTSRLRSRPLHRTHQLAHANW
jgi:hypothetical protein